MPQTEPTQTEQTKHFQCRHIHVAGRRCRSLSLSGEQLCFYHHTTLRSADQVQARAQARADAQVVAAGYPIQPALRFHSFEDRACIQLALVEIMNRIVSGAIDKKLAGLLLYSLQIAASLTPREPKAAASEDDQPITQITVDPELGPLAPIFEVPEPSLEKDRPQTWVETFLLSLKDKQEEYEREQAALNQTPTNEPHSS